MNAVGTAQRVKFHDAKRAFEDGGEIMVSEYGHEERREIYRDTTTHTIETTDWDELVDQVRMWRHRYPNQRFYIVTRISQVS